MMGDVKRGMGCFYGLLLRWVWAESVYKLKKMGSVQETVSAYCGWHLGIINGIWIKHIIYIGIHIFLVNVWLINPNPHLLK